MSDKFSQVLVLLKPLATLPDWGIGGSLLLVERQLQTDFRDIDLVCTTAVAETLDNAIRQLAMPVATTPHPRYCSRFFRRYQHSSGLIIELMAGIQVQSQVDVAEHLPPWPFDPATVTRRHGLPWMALSDWLVLYQWFERPEKVALIRAAQRRHCALD
jgi:hypothetical protein